MLRNGLEPWHLLIVALVVILLFGSKKLPDTARALGKSLRILKSETKAMKNDGAEPAATYESGEPARPEPHTIHAMPGGPATGHSGGTAGPGAFGSGATRGGAGYPAPENPERPEHPEPVNRPGGHAS
ncbi:Sec-independent protein translocase subunit TatA [Streptomyces sp. SF28]|nr:Sec-independent protein translocase subunit TatA [Streptomyces pinistramenti]MCB5909273.1 Sec-independent protein translocase subunit TatA [Streptomyces pinistramenti]